LKIFVDTLIQLCTGINHLETYGLVHRDLKGDNVLVDESGSVMICDFGEACFAPGLKRDINTLNGQLWGNRAFQPPEIANIKGNGIVDYSKADLWSAVAMMYDSVVPFPKNYQTKYFNINDLDPLPKFYPKDLVVLIGNVLGDVEQRPTTEKMIHLLKKININ